MDKFKLFLFNEERNFLGRKVGNVLTAMQDVQQDMPNLGSRHLTKLGEDLVNQIRKILHSRWSGKNEKNLRELQKIAVAIKKTIEDKGDLREILPTATQVMQNLSGKLGVKVNSLKAPDAIPGQDASPSDFQISGPEQMGTPQQSAGMQQSMTPPPEQQPPMPGIM